MPYEVRMPQLGMAQESGRLVAWLKAVGDPLTFDDPLMEVETDKTTVEVPAGADGVLVELRAAENTDVPVGHVVAVIAAAGETVSPGAQPMSECVANPPQTAPPGKDSVVGRDNGAVIASAPSAPADASTPRGARVLSSPKARRLALEQGLDLRELVASGVPEPLHVRDLARIPMPSPAQAAALSSVTARCDSLAFESFLARIADEGGIVIEPHILVAGFAAAALRMTVGAEQIVVSVETGTTGRRISYLDPDISRPSRPRLAAGDVPPSVLIIDITGSRITSVVAADSSVPTVSIAGGRGHAFDLTLTFVGTSLAMADAIALIDGLADRLEAPLRYVV